MDRGCVEGQPQMATSPPRERRSLRTGLVSNLSAAGLKHSRAPLTICAHYMAREDACPTCRLLLGIVACNIGSYDEIFNQS
jgi:hypothetical protein